MNNRKLLTIALTIFSTMLLCGSLFAQTAQQQIDIAEISNSGSNVSFIIKVPYESATLTVSTPNGQVFRQEFKAGSIPNFAPINESGEYFGSGKFTYELTLTPILSPSIKAALAQSRIDGNSDEVELDFRKRGMLPQPMIESGTFTFTGGTIITGSNLDKEPENRTIADETNVDPKNPTTKPSGDSDIPTDNAVVVNDDQIVLGSQCIGFDCVNSESFGFDTLRLKENNLRIHFDDTSTSASFPNNDWRLAANDTTNGGANRFSIEDATAGTIPFTVEAGAPNNSLYVDDSGKIGIKTSTPVVEIHNRDGDSPTLRLEQDGSSGFTPQTWDVAGNEVNFFVRDTTNGSKLPFKIIPNAPDNRIVIGPNGVGFSGDTSPGALIDVNNGKLTVDSTGKLTTQTSIEIDAGGIIFPDGTTQTTAASGGGGGGTANALGSSFAQHLLGGQGIVSNLSNIEPTIDFNSFGFGTNGQAGFAVATYAIPYNLNLASQSATMVTYQIRYRDMDGTGTASQVIIELVGQDINTGGRASTILFDSNTSSTTTVNTTTVCKSFDASNFNAAVRGMYLNVTLQGTAAQSADFKHIRIYKGLSCP